MTDGLLRHRGRRILAVIADAVRGEILPEPPMNARPDQREKDLSRELARVLDEKARALDIPASLLAPRRDLMAMAQGRRDLDVLEGWRWQAVGSDLLSLLNE